MQQSDDNSLIPVPIASQAASGNVATIPTAQATAGDGRVSIDLGYPPECAISVAAGGKYPEMQDANGVYKLLSSAIRAIQAWGVLPFNDAFAAAIGGYPWGSLVRDSAGNYWVSTADNNGTTPGAEGAAWLSLFNGYATQAWSNGQFLQLTDSKTQTVTGPVTFSGLTVVPKVTDWTTQQSVGASDADVRYLAKSLTTLQTVTGPVAFGGRTQVPSISDFTGLDALNAETAEGRYPASVPTTGQARITSLVQDADGRTLSNGAVLANLADIPIPLDQKIQYFTATHTSPGGHTVQFPVVFPEAFSSSNIMVIGIAFGENTTNYPLLLPNIEPGTETSTGLSFRMVGVQAGGAFDPPAGMVMTMNILAIGPK